MELLYVYVETLEDVTYNLGFNFSLDKYISLDNKKRLLIRDKDKNNILGNNFFGKKITNLNLIVGENGTGKTRLLSLLGLNRNYPLRLNKIWLAIYRGKEKNDWIIEGDNTLVENVVSNFNDNNIKLKKMEILLECAESKKQRIGYLASLPSVETYVPEENLGNLDLIENRHFNRHFNDTSYAAVLNFLNIYDFFNKEKSLYFKISLGYGVSSKDLREGFAHKFYGKGKKELLFNSENQLKPRYDSHKKDFVIFFLEQIALSIFENKNFNSSPVNEDESMMALYRSINKKAETSFSGLISAGENQYFLPESSEVTKILENYDLTKSYMIGIINVLLQFEKDIVNSNIKFEESPRISDEIIYNDKILELIESLCEKTYPFKSYKNLVIPFSKDKYFSNIEQIFKEIDSLNILRVASIFLPSMSSGQMNLLFHFSDLFLQLDYYESSNKNDIVLIIDEPEMHLHPEWSRQYIDLLIDFLEQSNTSLKFQIIIATHSPLFISDVPASNIIAISQNEQGQRIIEDVKYGFASNFYDIIQDTFFLKNSIGAFAEKKIKMVIDGFNEIAKKESQIEKNEKKITELNNNQQQIMQDSNKKKIQEIKKLIQKIDNYNVIPLIGNDLIQIKLTNMMNEYRKKYELETIDQLEVEIAKLQSQIEKLREINL